MRESSAMKRRALRRPFPAPIRLVIVAADRLVGEARAKHRVFVTESLGEIAAVADGAGLFPEHEGQDRQIARREEHR